MKILCIGDVVGIPGLDFFCNEITLLKDEYSPDFTVVNGENCDKNGTGLTHNGAQTLLQYANVVTTGNHCFRRCSEDFYAETPFVLRPANFPFGETSSSCCEFDTGRFGVLKVINLMGVAWMEPIDNPFNCIDNLLNKNEARFTIIDFHAESTAEKKAMAFHVDGRVSAIFGTHTHVQTADEQILPCGTGYITDVGMTGPYESVIGVEPQLAIQKQKEHIPVKFEVASGKMQLEGVLFTLDDSTGFCTDVLRISHKK